MTRAPVAVGVVDVTTQCVQWIRDIDPRGYEQAAVLLLRDSRPLDFVRASLVDGVLDLAPFLDPATTTVTPPPPPPPPRRGPLLTVVITTCNDADAVGRLVRTLDHSTYRDLEIVVVENRPDCSTTREALRGTTALPLRVVDEPVPGLSRARNRGLQAAEGSLIAFLDDDVTPSTEHLSWLVAAFRDVPAAVCVTGQILPAVLDTDAQQLLEEYGGFSKGFARAVHHGATRQDDALYPFAPGSFGSGANTAWRRQSLLDLGGWEELLGAGTPSRGGEDLEAFTRVLLAGGVLVYEPAALVFHVHRPAMADLQRQMFAYGVGLGAVVAHWLVQPTSRRQVLSRGRLGLRRLLDRDSPKNVRRTQGYPHDLMVRELVGFAVGPAAYAWSRAVTWRRDRPGMPLFLPVVRRPSR